jgi:PAS domain S-box-containing protein
MGLVLEHAGIGIAVLDPMGRIVVANTAFCELLGYEKSELLGIRDLAITHSDDVSADAALFRELLSGSRMRYTIDKRYHRKNGDVVWGRVIGTMLHDSSGDFVIAVVEDITEKRGIEEAAREARRAHERYALAARATNDVIWDWDAEQGTIIWNDALRTMFGYSPDQIDNRLQWWDGHIHPDDRERVVSGINSIIEKGGSSWNDEYRFERADGSFTEVLDRGYVARSENGTPIRMIGAMLDVTERKHAERTASFMAEASAVLASSLDYHSTLARVAELAVPLLADCCFVDLRTGDRSFERLALIYEDEERGKLARKLTDAESDLVRNVIVSGESKLVEQIPAAGESDEGMDSLRAMGIRSALIVPLVASPGDRPKGALTLAMSHSRRALAERDRPVVEDVARRAAMAIEHARLYAEAQNASLAKDEFLAILSHELSTPLTIILGWSGMLRGDDVTREELLRGIETIRASAQAQSQLIDDVLDLSRVTTGKLHLDVQPVPIGQLVADSLTAVRVAAAAKRIDLIAPETTTAGTVLGDSNRLRQVIWNLLTNAIKFTKPGGRVTVELENTPATVKLIVTDTGQGIARDFLTHVFEPFRQADASTTRAHGGLGLGLAIVHLLVEGHGGTVAAFSEGADRGSRFVVELPLVTAEAADNAVHPPGVGRDISRKSRSELNGVRVLFVDDQPEARDLARVIFSMAGAEATIVSSAMEALDALERNPIDIIVADIGMPEMDGYALIAEIRRRDALAGRHTPAIAATAYRGKEDQQRVLAAGFDAYVRKPMDAATLTSAVASITAAARNG